MPKLIDLVDRLAEAFDRLGVSYAIGGALANNYGGIVRATQDVDCLIALPAIKYQLFCDALSNLGCALRSEAAGDVAATVATLREQVLTRKLIEAYCDSIRIEMFVPAVPLQDEILRRAVSIHLGDREVRVTTAEYLVLLKLAFHRHKDLQDVRGILWVQRGNLDIEYLRKWSACTHQKEVQQELDRLIDDYLRDRPDTAIQ
jgi:hypothetical protein